MTVRKGPSNTKQNHGTHIRTRTQPFGQVQSSSNLADADCFSAEAIEPVPFDRRGVDQQQFVQRQSGQACSHRTTASLPLARNS